MEEKSDFVKKCESIRSMIATVKANPPSVWAETFVRSLDVEFSRSLSLTDKQIDVLIKLYRQCYKV